MQIAAANVERLARTFYETGRDAYAEEEGEWYRGWDELPERDQEVIQLSVLAMVQQLNVGLSEPRVTGRRWHAFSCREGLRECRCICGDDMVGIAGVTYFCELDPDHLGRHRDGGTEWVKA